MTQTNIFDFVEAKRLKDEGMAQAASNRKELLKEARTYAIHYALNFSGDRTCTADDVAWMMETMHKKYSDLGNAAGSIFKSNDWAFTGRYKKSTKVSAHARDIKVWKLKEDTPC